MKDSTFKEKVRHLLEALSTALLFGMQTILNAGVAISIMSIPLLPYLYYYLIGQISPFALNYNIWVMFLSPHFMTGRLIALIGFAVFLLSLIQLLWNRVRGVGLSKTGMYSVVRHPQFLGIIVVTVGLTLMALTLGGGTSSILWIVQVFGYIGIARYEEAHLQKRFGESFRQYKRDVPFIFPIKCPSRIPETLFTIVIAILIGCMLWFFPYDTIRLP